MSSPHDLLATQSKGNATTTVLAADATYTGTWELVRHNDVAVMVKADVAGTLYCDFYDPETGVPTSGTTAQSTLTFSVAAGVPSVHRLVKGYRYFRVRYTNGSTVQTSFVVHVSYGTFGPLTSPLNLSLGKSSDALVTRAVPTEVDIALGRFGGFTGISKWGFNPDISIGSEDVWTTGGTMSWPTTATVVSIVSGSDNDNGGAATGAISVTVEGLDANWAAQTETVTLNGTGTVTTTNSFIRVNRAYVAVTGTYHGANAGAITGSIGGAAQFTIAAGQGQTQMARYSVPASNTLLVEEVTVVIGSNKTAQVFWWQTPNANDVTSTFSGAKRIVREYDTVSGEITEKFTIPLAFPAYTDLWFSATVVANNTTVTAAMNGVLVDVS